MEYVNKVRDIVIKTRRDKLNNPMNIARFCLPSVFKQISIGLYLDVDTIVQSPISELFKKQAKFQNIHCFATVYRAPLCSADKAQAINAFFNNEMHAKYPSIITYPIEFKRIKYFNAGILLYNFDIWRELNLTEQSLDLFEFKRDFTERTGIKKFAWSGVTQVVMNFLFLYNGLKIYNVARNWNFVIHEHGDGFKCRIPVLDQQSEHALSYAKIIHWAGYCKPWERINVSSLSYWAKYIPKNANISEWEMTLNEMYKSRIDDGSSLNINLKF